MKESNNEREAIASRNSEANQRAGKDGYVYASKGRRKDPGDHK